MRAMEAMCLHIYDYFGIFHWILFHLISVYFFLSSQNCHHSLQTIKTSQHKIQWKTAKTNHHTMQAFSSLLPATENRSPQEEAEKVYCPYTVPHHTAVWLTHPSLPSLVYSCQLSYLAHVCPLWPCMASSLLSSLLLTSVLLFSLLSSLHWLRLLCKF